MASFKSLFLVAFALSAAILSVSASPLAKEDVHSVVAGKRESGDYLVHEVKIVEHLEQFDDYPMILRRGYRVSPFEVITQVKVVDLMANGEGPDMSIYSGGPGSQYVSLLFQSEHYKGINVAVEVYAKRDSETQ